MTHDLKAAAMQHYHDRFDAAQYNVVGEFLASNLNADRDESRVVDILIALQNMAFGLCDHPDYADAWHSLAVQCGQSFLSFHTVDAMRDFLRRFAPDDVRIEDFEATAKGMLRAYSGLDDLKTATTHANGVHSWQGRMAYELLAAVDYLTQTAVQMLAHGDENYAREKLHKGMNRITGALYEGIRHSEQPSL
ncbi:MAG: hypothetical protein IPO91_29090 [Chloroflexi bacterium]|nr:hypothetical protein [Chloroflexota bacterium]